MSIPKPPATQQVYLLDGDIYIVTCQDYLEFNVSGSIQVMQLSGVWRGRITFLHYSDFARIQLVDLNYRIREN